MTAYGLRISLAALSVLLQPRRFLAAFACTIAVAASAAAVYLVAPPGEPSLMAAVYGGLVAFNLLLMFPPGGLTRPPFRLAAGLAAHLAPLTLAPFLYGISIVLADAAVILAAALSVLARPLGVPLNTVATLFALNLLIPLVMGGAPGLIRLGAVAAVIGTAFAAAADAAVAWLRAGTPDLERALLRRQIAGFLAELSRSWRKGQALPNPILSARIALVRKLCEEMAPIAPQRAGLPADAILDAIVHSAAELRGQAGTLSAVVEAALQALAEAARSDRPDRAGQAIEEMRQAAMKPPLEDRPGPPPRMLGLTLLLSDAIAAAMAGHDTPPEPA